MNLLNQSYQLETIKKFKQQYKLEMLQYREDIQEDYENPHLSQDFQDFFTKAIKSSKLNEFSNINWNWLKLVESIVQVIFLHEELTIGEDLELSESEDELFNFWHDSDYANVFLENINESKDLLTESKKLFSLLQEQVMAYFILHIDRTITIPEVTYCAQTELGESEDRIYLDRSFVNLSNKDLFYKVSNSNELKINNENIALLDKRQISHTLEIRTFKQEHDEDLDKHIHRIKNSINMIKNISPDLYTTFINFTNVIVPINEKGLVSYSMQNLPAHSCINLYDRDDIDLLDDLLHENGHHYMNTFLNVNDLIIEDEEKIYYSPWRRALRPIRGIYHAYFTFYWAFILFRSLRSSKYEEFSTEDQIKINQRFCEEYIMLNFCWPDLLIANKEEKITEDGFDVISLINGDLSSQETSNAFVETLAELAALDIEKYQLVKELIKHLEETREHYS